MGLSSLDAKLVVWEASSSPQRAKVLIPDKVPTKTSWSHLKPNIARPPCSKAWSIKVSEWVSEQNLQHCIKSTYFQQNRNLFPPITKLSLWHVWLFHQAILLGKGLKLKKNRCDKPEAVLGWGFHCWVTQLGMYVWNKEYVAVISLLVNRQAGRDLPPPQMPVSAYLTTTKSSDQ